LITRYVEDYFTTELGDPGIIYDTFHKNVQFNENNYILQITKTLKGEGIKLKLIQNSMLQMKRKLEMQMDS
jgi:hypothetical protein